MSNISQDQVRNIIPHYLNHRTRLRTRFMDQGIDGLQPYEVIELFLTFVMPRQDVKAEAKEIINRFGSVKGFFDADPRELREVKLVKDKAITLIRFIKEVSSLYQTGVSVIKPLPIANSLKYKHFPSSCA